MINLAEIVNPCLQLVIFSLLTMDYDGYEEQNKVQFYRYEEVKNEKYNNVPAEAYELQL